MPKHVKFRLAETSDAEFIQKLRGNGNKTKYLSKTKTGLQAQKEWLIAYKKREKQKLEYYFIIEDELARSLGVVRIYDLQGDSFCWGSWILHENAPNYAAIESALLIYETAFHVLGFKRAHFDVRKKNERVLAFHKRFGAKVVYEDEDNYYFNYDMEAYEKTKLRYRKFFKEKNNHE